MNSQANRATILAHVAEIINTQNIQNVAEIIRGQGGENSILPGMTVQKSSGMDREEDWEDEY